jgi:hypothetical protein
MGPRCKGGSGSPEVQQSRKEYDHANKARSQHIADIVAGNACSSLDSSFFSSALCVVFGHGKMVTSLDQQVRQQCVPYVEGTRQKRPQCPGHPNRLYRARSCAVWRQRIGVEAAFFAPCDTWCSIKLRHLLSSVPTVSERGPIPTDPRCQRHPRRMTSTA